MHQGADNAGERRLVKQTSNAACKPHSPGSLIVTLVLLDPDDEALSEILLPLALFLLDSCELLTLELLELAYIGKYPPAACFSCSS